MQITVDRLASGTILRVTGRLDADGALELEKALKAALDTGVARLIVDMAGVDYIASAGIRPLLAAYKRVQAEDRFVEIIRAQPTVAKVLTVVGLGDLLPLGSGTMQIIDLLKQQNPYNDQAMRSARQFVLDLLTTLGIGKEQAANTTEDIFHVCRSMPTAVAVEEELKKLLADLDLGARIGESLKDRSRILFEQIKPYVAEGSILDIGAGDGRVGAAFQDGGREVRLVDVVDYNATDLPFKLYDGVHIPFPDKSFDYSFLIVVLHHCDEPLKVLDEAMRVTRKRIIINESVYLNEANRRFNMFFDWFYNRVLHDGVNVPYNFNSPEGWEHLFRELGLQIAASVDIGLDQITVPEYHWMYVLDLAK